LASSARARLLGLLVTMAACEDDAPPPEGHSTDAGDATVDASDAAPDASDTRPAKPPRDAGRRDVPCTDDDHDGFGTGCARGPDCDDGDPRVHPAGLEVCNGADDDCDSLTDEEDPLVEAACDVESAGCRFPGVWTCHRGERRCFAGRPVIAGSLPHVTATADGWVLSWLAPGAEVAGRLLQVFATRLDAGGSMLEARDQLSRAQGLEPRAPRSLAAGEGTAAWLGPPDKGSLELHVVLGRLGDPTEDSLAKLEPTATFPAHLRVAAAERGDGGLAVAAWDGQTDPGGVRLVVPGAEPVTAVGGAAAWAALAPYERGWLLGFVRPGDVRLLELDPTGQALAPELVVAEEEARRLAIAAPDGPAALLWLTGDPEEATATLRAARADGGPARTLDRTAAAGDDPSLAALPGGLVAAWTGLGSEGAEVRVGSVDGLGGATSLGPGAAPVLADHPDGPALVFDRGGRIHFLQAACP